MRPNPAIKQCLLGCVRTAGEILRAHFGQISHVARKESAAIVVCAADLAAERCIVDRIRGATQGFIAFILWGVGALVGTQMAGRVLAAHTLAAPTRTVLHDWSSIRLTPALGAVVVLVISFAFFRNPLAKTAPARCPSTTSPNS